MTDDTGAPRPKSSPNDPPAANQHQDEAIPTSPDESAQAGDSGAADEAAATGAGKDQVPDEADGVDETHGVPVAGTYAVGSSGEGASARGGIPAVTRSGKPDGEVDTRA
jgi:hypothetical protein